MELTILGIDYSQTQFPRHTRVYCVCFFCRLTRVAMCSENTMFNWVSFQLENIELFNWQDEDLKLADGLLQFTSYCQWFFNLTNIYLLIIVRFINLTNIHLADFILKLESSFQWIQSWLLYSGLNVIFLTWIILFLLCCYWPDLVKCKLCVTTSA